MWLSSMLMWTSKTREVGSKPRRWRRSSRRREDLKVSPNPSNITGKRLRALKATKRRAAPVGIVALTPARTASKREMTGGMREGREVQINKLSCIFPMFFGFSRQLATRVSSLSAFPLDVLPFFLFFFLLILHSFLFVSAVQFCTLCPPSRRLGHAAHIYMAAG